MVNARRFSPHFSAWLLTALLLSLALPCSALGQSKPLKHIYIGVSSVSMLLFCVVLKRNCLVP